MSRSVPRRRAMPLAGLTALSLALAACSGGSSSTPPASGGEPPADCARVDGAGVITFSADNLKFSAPCLVANAGEAFTIHFTNEDSEPHNVAGYQDASKANEIFRGAYITGPDQSTDVEVGALDAGEYYFDCQIHTNMNGTLYVVAAGG